MGRISKRKRQSQEASAGKSAHNKGGHKTPYGIDPTSPLKALATGPRVCPYRDCRSHLLSVWIQCCDPSASSVRLSVETDGHKQRIEYGCWRARPPWYDHLYAFVDWLLVSELACVISLDGTIAVSIQIRHANFPSFVIDLGMNAFNSFIFSHFSRYSFPVTRPEQSKQDR